MKKVTLLFILLALSYCNNVELKKIEFIFYPAFMYPTKFTIDPNNNLLTIYNFQSQYEYEEKIDTNIYKNKSPFGGLIMSKIVFKDTLVVHYIKTFKIEKHDLNEFIKSIEFYPDTNINHTRHDVLDGVSFDFNKIKNETDTFTLKCVCPDRSKKYELDYKLLDAFFKLSSKTINDYKGICLTENIQDYFSYGLPIKLTNNEPLEYRIWGTISGCRLDNDELVAFLKNLPDSKPILFDLRNGSFSPCLYELFDDYGHKKSIFYYGKDSLDNEWTEIKLKNSFKTKEQVIKTIANMQYNQKGR